MKNILLLGDSIRIGYDKSVKKSLEGIANVYFPEDNTRFASYLLRYLTEYDRLIKDGTVDVLHWNAGLWDTLRLLGEDPHTPKDVYAYYIERICIRIKKLWPNAKVIFATSTFVNTDELPSESWRSCDEIHEYNQIAVEIVKKYGFEIDDLEALSQTLPREAHSDPVHFYTKLGTEAFSKQVLKCLSQVLELEEVPTYKEVMYEDEPVGC